MCNELRNFLQLKGQDKFNPHLKYLVIRYDQKIR